jgi:hypothetical protein
MALALALALAFLRQHPRGATLHLEPRVERGGRGSVPTEGDTAAATDASIYILAAILDDQAICVQANALDEDAWRCYAQGEQAQCWKLRDRYQLLSFGVVSDKLLRKFHANHTCRRLHFFAKVLAGV